MTFLELQDAVLDGRFNSSQRTAVKRWLTAEYALVWHFANWTFKRVSALETAGELAISANDRTPTMPATFAEAIALLNENRDPLVRLAPDVFEASYGDPNASTGEPDAYTIVNRQVYLGPVPSTSRTFYLAHTRLLCHKEVDGTTLTAGKMTEDDDQPVWSEDHHELLIAGARARGKKREQDPTWQADQAERDELLNLMLADPGLLPAATGAFGARDPL